MLQLDHPFFCCMLTIGAKQIICKYRYRPMFGDDFINQTFKGWCLELKPYDPCLKAGTVNIRLQPYQVRTHEGTASDYIQSSLWQGFEHIQGHTSLGSWYADQNPKYILDKSWQMLWGTLLYQLLYKLELLPIVYRLSGIYSCWVPEKKNSELVRCASSQADRNNSG